MRTTANPIRRGRRRGLATLELVLALPILLFLMALMVNFGTVASWKVRALCAARHSIWGNRSPRSTANFPRPTGWPPSAGMGVAGLPPVLELDGPRVSSPPLGPPGSIDPNTDVMNPTLGLLQGSADMVRQFPMLGKMGQYHLNAQTELLDNTWDFQRMGLGANTAFRIPTIYILPPAPDQEAWAQAYSNVRNEILGMIFGPVDPRTLEPPIWPLDRETDFITYGQIIQLVEPSWNPASPDFHPWLRGFCSLDTTLADERVYGLDDAPGLIDRIQGNKDRRVSSLAESMSRAFINLYQRAIQAYQSLLGADPPPSAAQRAAMQAEIGQLQQKIDTLNQFLQTFENNHGG
ncbi:MAG: pilus assembly protein [Planctomycetes bacterium]|nr:pilus assembly protein [Planctomycetota bacterium]MBU4398898.1 pilus assembly protein [Planctomycetota bacterium]MCG2685607.1 pilus assembly protein [Planctomycetales bacterium]